MGIGEAFVTLLNEKGIPTPLIHTLLCSPKSRMDILAESEIDALTAKSKLAAKYNKVIDSESAYEILTAKLAAAQAASASAEEEVATTKATKKEDNFFDNPVVKQVGRTAAAIITRSLLGALGLGGRSTSRKR